MMGTFISISTAQENKIHIQKGFAIISDVEMSLSSYKKKALVSKLNHEKKTNLDENLFEALQLSQKYYQETNGYFNIAIGSITKGLYRFGEQERIPHAKELKEANVDLKGLHFNKSEAFLDQNTTIDLGGMGKGFGVDKVAHYFKSKNIVQAVIAASGDIRCLGECHTNIQNPHAENFLASFDTLKDETGISTSGNYNRYVKSVKNNHLINPKSKKSEQNFSSITLISDISSSDLDAYTTAVSVMPKEQAYSFLASKPLAYIILQSDAKLVVSKNSKQFIKNLKIY